MLLENVHVIGLHGGNRLASNSLIEAVVYADSAAQHSIDHVDEFDFNEKVPGME